MSDKPSKKCTNAQGEIIRWREGGFSRSSKTEFPLGEHGTIEALHHRAVGSFGLPEGTRTRYIPAIETTLTGRAADVVIDAFKALRKQLSKDPVS